MIESINSSSVRRTVARTTARGELSAMVCDVIVAALGLAVTSYNGKFTRTILYGVGSSNVYERENPWLSSLCMESPVLVSNARQVEHYEGP